MNIPSLGPRLAAPGPTAPAPRQASPFPTLNFPMRFDNPQAPRGMVPPSNTPSPVPPRPGGQQAINMRLPSPQFATPTPSPGMGFPTPIKHPTPSPGVSPLLNPGLGKRLPGVNTGKRKIG